MLLLSLCLPAACSCLGVWQVQRLQQKRKLLHELGLAFRQPPAESPLFDGSNPPATYKKYRLPAASLLPSQGIALVGPRFIDGCFGYFLVLPLQPADDSQAPLLLDCGFVPLSRLEETVDAVIAGLQQPQQQQIVAYALRDEPRSWLAAAPKSFSCFTVFSSLDAAAIGAFCGLSAASSSTVFRQMPTAAAAAAAAAGGPQPIRKNIDLAGVPNNHREYAFTWFSFAAASAAISWLRRRR